MENLIINKNIEAKASFEWIKSGFYCFREQPLHFILLSIIFIGIGLLPLFSAFMSPLFTARFAAIAKKIESGERIKVSELFNNFFANATLVRLAFLSFLFSALIMTGMSLVGKELAFVFLLPFAVLLLGLWLSPIICLNNPDISPLPAMWLSIQFAIYNVPVAFLFSILVLVFTILACIPLGLGLLIWVPVLNITSYYIYKDAFARVSGY